MTSMTNEPSTWSPARRALCLAGALMFIAQPVTGQVTGSPESIASFLGDQTLDAAILEEWTISWLEEATEADVRSDWSGALGEPSEEPECFERWDMMILEERVACIRPWTESRTTEWLPALGMILFERPLGNTAYARMFPGPYVSYVPKTWSVEQDGERFFMRLGANDRMEITYFDGSWLTIDFQETWDAFLFLSFGGPGNESGRDRDSALLAGDWILEAVDDNPLRDLPPVTYALRGDGTFEISGSVDVDAGEASHRGGAITEGLWRLSMSTVPLSDAQDLSVRVLVLGSGEEDHTAAHQVFLVEHLDDTSLTLAIEGGAGGQVASRLHFRR
jgi:hypothetical protein